MVGRSLKLTEHDISAVQSREVLELFFSFFVLWPMDAQMLQRGRTEMILFHDRSIYFQIVDIRKAKRVTMPGNANVFVNWSCQLKLSKRRSSKRRSGTKGPLLRTRRRQSMSFDNCLGKRGRKPNQVFVLCKLWLNGRGVVCNFLLLLRWIRVSTFFVSLSNEVWKWFSSRLR